MAGLEKIASRYAKAIFDFQASAKAKDLLADLETFSRLIEQNKDLNQLATSDFFSGVKQKEVVKDLTEKMKLSEPAQRTLQVLAEMKRLGALPKILERLGVLIHEANDVAPLKVESSETLTPDLKEKVESRFSKLLGRKVQASYTSDEKLIGGLRVTAGNRTFDGSISGWLSSVEEQLVDGAL